MAEAGIPPTGVRDRISHSPPDAILVGDPDTMWGDASDATYAYREDSEPANGILLADIAPWTRGRITAIDCAVRLQLDTNNIDPRFGLWGGPLGTEAPSGDTGPNAFFLTDATTDHSPESTPGVTNTVTGFKFNNSITSDELTLDEVNYIFSAGFTMGISRRIATGSGSLTVFLVAFQITYTPHTIPARRLYPRTDHVGPGLGRVFPPPNTPQSGARFGSSSPV